MLQKKSKLRHSHFPVNFEKILKSICERLLLIEEAFKIHALTLS